MTLPEQPGQVASTQLRNSGSSGFISWLIVGVVCINLVAIGYASLNLHRSWLDTLRAAEARSRTVAYAVDQSITSNVDKVDISLQTVVNGIEAQLAHGGKIRPTELNLILAQQARMLPDVSGFRIMDANGQFITGNGIDSSTNLRVSEREYFQKLKAGEAQGLFINKPILSNASHRWIIPFVRRFNTPDGKFGGVVSVPISIEYFSQLLEHFEIGSTDATSLRYLDLGLIARYPPNDTNGKKMEVGSNNISDTMRHLAATGELDLTYRTIDPYDQTHRVNTYHRISNAPFVIIAGVGQAEFQKAWYRELWQTIAFLAGCAFVSALLARLVFHYWREQVQALQSVTASHLKLQAAVAALTERDQALARAQEAGKLGTYTIDYINNNGFGSASFNLLVGIGNDAVLTHDLWESLIHPDDRTEALSKLTHAVNAKRQTYTNEFRILRKTDGKTCWVSDLANLEYTLDGTLHSINGVFQDVGERKAFEERLLLTHEAFQHSVEGIFVTDNHGAILEINPAFTRISGFTQEDIAGATPRILKSGIHPDSVYTDMWQTLTTTGTWEGELQNKRKDGKIYTQFSRISAVRDSKGAFSRFICLASDVTELRETQSRIEHLAYFDALTDLPNRRLLTNRLQLALAQTDRHKDLIGICYLDLDRFKPINDEWGHDTGDKVLIEIGRRLQACVRDGDTVARIGGDEFVVLFDRIQDEIELSQAIKRMLAVIAEPIRLDKTSATMTMSVGVTIYPNDTCNDADGLIRHADQAMYVAKRAGKNQMHMFDAESERRLREHHDLFSRLIAAYHAKEFRLYYQPKVHIRSGEVVGAEALIRWQHPEQGVLPPNVFLPTIDNTELSVLVGEWVIREAMQQMSIWASHGLILPVSVNISGHHLQRSDLVSRLETILSEFPDVQPAWLELEILETTAMEDIEKTTRLINECMKLGVSFALDDFGTGYSSLTYFRRLPVGTTKIDRSFVIDMLTDPTDHALVAGIVGLAHSLQREVVAEGVETIEHGIPLLQMGCDIAQGYGIARPMPADKVQDWVSTWRVPQIWRDVGAS